MVESNPKIQTSLSANASPENAPEGSTVTISGSLAPAGVAALEVACTDPGGNVTNAAVSTDASGNYTWQQAGCSVGDWTVEVRYAGSVSREPCEATAHFRAAVHEVTFDAGPTVDPARVASGGSASCSAAASDSLGHAVTYHWSDSGSGGSFAPSAAAQNPTYTAPVNVSGDDELVSISCTAACAESEETQCVRSAVLTVESAPVPRCTVTAPASPTNTSPLTFGIQFTEAVTGLTAASAVVGGGHASGLTGEGASYTLSVTPSRDGVVTCQVPAGAAIDAGGLPNAASNTASATFDTTAPVVVIAQPTTDPSCVRVGDHMMLRGSASGDAAAVGWVNETTGESGERAGTSAWSVGSVSLVPGENAICVTATDVAGNSGTARVTANRIDVDADAFVDAWRGSALVSVPLVPDSDDPKTVVGFVDQKWCRFDSLWCGYVYYPDASTLLRPSRRDAVPRVLCGVRRGRSA